MEMTTYYGMDKNPFIKDAAVSTLFTSNDFKQMTNWNLLSDPEESVSS